MRELDRTSKKHAAMRTLLACFCTIGFLSAPSIAATSAYDTNRVVVDSLGFNDTTNSIVVSLSLDTADAGYREGVKAGIGYSYDGIPGVAANLSEIIFNGVSARIAIPLGEDIQFETRYYIAAWMWHADSGWLPPAESGIDSITTPSFTWRRVQVQPVDTLRIAGGKILFLGVPSLDDTVTSHKLPSTARGFATAGIGFDFKRMNNGETAPFSLGIKIDPAYPDARMYRDSSGILKVEYASYVENGYVWVNTNAIAQPFLALADLSPPTVSVLVDSTDTSAIVSDGDSIATCFAISDNIGNMSWKFEYGRGNEAYSSSRTTYLADTADTMVGIVPGASVSGYFGCRIRCIVSDGAHADTIDVSRRVTIARSDVVTALERQWTPIRATSSLDDKAFNPVFSGLGVNEPGWVYDTKVFRLFRWTSRPGAGPVHSWVEYEKNVDSLFRATPGRVMWLKTAEDKTIELGRGVSMSLKAPFTMSLPPKNWTDFSTPFQFEIAWGDIVDASGVASDSLQLYHWQKLGGAFEARPVYLPDMSGHSARSTSLNYLPPNDAYTVYNPFDAPVELAIPPIPRPMSSYLSKKQIAKPQSRTQPRVFAIVANAGGAEIGKALCGVKQGAGNTYYPLPPSFRTLRIGLRNPMDGKVYAHALKGHYTASSPVIYEVVFMNDANTDESILCHLEGLSALGDNMQAKAYTNGAETGSGGRFSVTVPAHGRAVRWVAAGDAKGLASLSADFSRQRLDLCGIWPNPVKKRARIEYTAPLGGIKSISFAIYDMKGRALWQAAVNNPRPGQSSIMWRPGADGQKIASGTYLLRMTAAAVNPDESARIFERRITLLP